MSHLHQQPPRRWPSNKSEPTGWNTMSETQRGMHYEPAAYDVQPWEDEPMPKRDLPTGRILLAVFIVAAAFIVACKLMGKM
jgi:hypothetical protein